MNMTPNEQNALANFAGALFDWYREGDHMDLDGCDMGDLLAKHGLMYETKATEADCEEEWCQDFGCEVGDTIFKYGALMLRLMQQARSRAATERKARDG